MQHKSIWTLLEASMDILGESGYPAMDGTASALGLDSQWFSWVPAVWLFGVEPISAAKFMRMFPYGLLRLNEERLASAAKQGYLRPGEGAEFHPTERGLEIARSIWRAAGDSLAGLQPMPEDDLRRLLGYMTRLVEASLAAPEPPAQFYLSHKKENYQRLETIYALERFVVLIGELAAFRDDMYIAGWQAHKIEGHAWDLFDRIYASQSISMDGLYAKLKGRGLPQEIYAQDLLELIRRSWVQPEANEYRITPAGRKVREDVEAQTDELFFGPWACLGEDDLDPLLELAAQLHAGLQKVR